MYPSHPLRTTRAWILRRDESAHPPLRRKGHDVKAATSVFEAYRTRVDFIPDVLVIDWMLGASVDGIQVAEVLRAELPGLQVILITGRPSETLQSEAATAKISTVLTKPFNLTELTEAIEGTAAGNV